MAENIAARKAREVINERHKEEIARANTTIMMWHQTLLKEVAIRERYASAIKWLIFLLIGVIASFSYTIRDHSKTSPWKVGVPPEDMQLKVHEIAPDRKVMIVQTEAFYRDEIERWCAADDGRVITDVRCWRK